MAYNDDGADQTSEFYHTQDDMLELLYALLHLSCGSSMADLNSQYYRSVSGGIVSCYYFV